MKSTFFILELSLHHEFSGLMIVYKSFKTQKFAITFVFRRKSHHDVKLHWESSFSSFFTQAGDDAFTVIEWQEIWESPLHAAWILFEITCFVLLFSSLCCPLDIWCMVSICEFKGILQICTTLFMGLFYFWTGEELSKKQAAQEATIRKLRAQAWNKMLSSDLFHVFNISIYIIQI